MIPNSIQAKTVLDTCACRAEYQYKNHEII